MLTLLQRGTLVVEDTGELVVHGRKSKKKDSDAESVTSRGTFLCRTLTRNTTAAEVVQLPATADLKHSSSIYFVSSLC